MINIVHDAETVANGDQCLQYIDYVVSAENRRSFSFDAPQTTIELHAPNGRKIVSLGGEEQIGEKVLCGILCGRLARTHHAVNLDKRLESCRGRVNTQCVGNERPAIEIIRIDGLEFLDTSFENAGHYIIGNEGIAHEQNFAGLRIDYILGQRFAKQKLFCYFQFCELGLLHLTDVTSSNATPFFNNQLAFLVCNREIQHFTAQSCGNQFKDNFHVLASDFVSIVLVEHSKNVLRRVVKRTEQNSRRQLATSVDSHKDHVFGIKLEIEPRTTVRNNASRVEQLS